MTLKERFPTTSDLVAFTEKFAHDATLQKLLKTYTLSHSYLYNNIDEAFVDLDGYATNVYKAGQALNIYINHKLDIL